MPGYPWLFSGSPTRPGREALDVVNYLESLGREARLAGLTGPRPLAGRDSEEEKRKGMFCDCSIPRTAGKAPVWDTRLAAGEGERFARRGAEVFARNCSGCHGRQGLGDGSAAVALIPVPRNLTTARFSDRSLSESLWNGVPGSSMPSWSDLPSGELRGLVAYLQAIAPTEPPTDLNAEERAKGKVIFVKQCAVCHGQDGAGDGPTAAMLTPAPTNFHEVGPTLDYAESALTNGVRGTAMPKWGPKLRTEERSLLARFVRSFYGKPTVE
jgi:mono/diheme cytochrome c family protein